jgi:predicted O-methyltransferase YrrM
MNDCFAVTAADYARIFEAERAQDYPVVDDFEARMGHEVDRQRLLEAARVLACPLKVNPPNWQHGRVLFALAMEYLVRLPVQPVTLLDIGTAKGFSALMLRWALQYSGQEGEIHSVDVLDPHGTERRNSVLECDGPKTLAQCLTAWPESLDVTFHRSTGIEWLKQHRGRVHIAFVDGKHTAAAVSEEARLLADRQSQGDVVLFDDAQIKGVADAIDGIRTKYAVEHLTIKPGRSYVIARRV